MKTIEITNIYAVLNEAKLTKMEDADKFKVIKALRVIKPIAKGYEDFIEEAKVWLSIRTEYTKLEIIDKVVQICTVLALSVIFLFLIFIILIYLSFTAAYALNTLIDSLATSFLLVSIFYILVLLLLYLKRHTWIERPLVRFLVQVLLNGNKDREETPELQNEERNQL